MPRNLDPAFAASLTARNVALAFLSMITFASSTQYVWSGVGPLSWGGNTFLGVGSLGYVGAVAGGTEVKATGTQVALSGIDPVFLGEAMADVHLGAPATIWLASFDTSTGRPVMIGAPDVLFAGFVDKPPVAFGVEKIAIALMLEDEMINHERASCRRYTNDDQAVKYPDDTAFLHVEQLNDLALRWGS